MAGSSASVSQRVAAMAARLPTGTAVPVRAFWACGSATAVRSAVARLVARGVLVRAARGVYARPHPNRYFGAALPPPAEIARAIAEATGERLAPHGAELALRLGLSTQVPVQAVYYTSGRSRRVRVGQGHIHFEHAPARLVAQADGRAGAALLALHYLGPAHVTPQVLRALHGRVPLDELARLPYVPAWLRARLGRPDAA